MKPVFFSLFLVTEGDFIFIYIESISESGEKGLLFKMSIHTWDWARPFNNSFIVKNHINDVECKSRLPTLR